MESPKDSHWKIMDSPIELHWKINKRILRYIVGSIQHGIMYKASKESSLLGSIDSDFACSIDDWKSTYG